MPTRLEVSDVDVDVGGVNGVLIFIDDVQSILRRLLRLLYVCGQHPR
jgi:hypothetical protein